nr:fibrobacter succinogenes major paralogous domain-containing protein [Bacteroidota bacterium]
MKKNALIIISIFTVITISLKSQVAINTDGSPPDSSAALDVQSTERGLLIPRLTEAEIGQIQNPANGLFVFNSTSNKFFVYVASENAWKEMAFGSGTISPPCGTPLTDIDGNTYSTVKIGTQCWTRENLKTTRFNNGGAIAHLTDNTQWSNNLSGAYCWYNNDTSWKDKYGALYNWEVLYSSREVCPLGWHTPTVEDWATLTTHLGGTGSPYGNQLKSCRQINSPLGEDCSTSEHPRWNENSTNYGTDDHGFSALPGGYRRSDGGFEKIGQNSYWWTSTSNFHLSGEARYLAFSSGGVSSQAYGRNQGFSIRCVRD